MTQHYQSSTIRSTKKGIVLNMVASCLLLTGSRAALSANDFPVQFEPGDGQVTLIINASQMGFSNTVRNPYICYRQSALVPDVVFSGGVKQSMNLNSPYSCYNQGGTGVLVSPWENADTFRLFKGRYQYVLKGLQNGATYNFRVGGFPWTGDVYPTYGQNVAVTVGGYKLAPLDDTGISVKQCHSGSSLVDCTSQSAISVSNAQDGMIGVDADPAKNSNSDGVKGFQFQKFAADGTALPATATSWDCVLDGRTGLWWENKTADGSVFRDGSKTYSYTQPNAFTPDAVVTASISRKICNTSGWRLPTAVELQSIVDYGTANPEVSPAVVGIDGNFFQNTAASYWSSSVDTGNKRFIVFGSGNIASYDGGFSASVRLVRIGPPPVTK